VRLGSPIAASDTEVADGTMYCMYGIGLLERTTQHAARSTSMCIFGPYLSYELGVAVLLGIVRSPIWPFAQTIYVQV
jgi:hypothetical protein